MIVNHIVKNLTYANTGKVLLGSVPANSVISSIRVHSDAAFNSSSSDVLDIGDATTANKYVNDVNLQGTGDRTVTRQTASFGVLSATGSTPIYGTIVSAGTSLSAGNIYVIIESVQLLTN